MIPKGGAAFLAPLFGNWAGKDDMTKYFFKDTPLAGLEQQMMTPPNFTPRGGGQMILCRFRYRPEDVDCKNCTEYRKKRDTLQVCPWLEERAEAGVVTYVVLASEFYKHWMDGLLGNRIRKVLSGKKAVTYYNEGHAARLQVYSTYLASHWKRDDGNRRLAAMYLMTATEPLRRWALQISLTYGQRLYMNGVCCMDSADRNMHCTRPHGESARDGGPSRSPSYAMRTLWIISHWR